jgi:hypothetical protein
VLLKIKGMYMKNRERALETLYNKKECPLRE